MGKGRRYLAGLKRGAIEKEDEGRMRRGERAKGEKKEEQEVLEQVPTPTPPLRKPENSARNTIWIVIDIKKYLKEYIRGITQLF